MLKHELRSLFLQKRNALSDLEKSRFDREIKIRFQQFLPEKINTVHIYLPIQSKVEINTWPIIKQLWGKNIKVVVPMMHEKTVEISSWELNKETQLPENKWNIPEPINSKKIDDSSIDAVIVPLLAVDQKGFRVGYGKGYYDSFLSSLNPDTLKIGLSYFTPIEAISNIDQWDIPLDYCITPEQTIKF